MLSTNPKYPTKSQYAYLPVVMKAQTRCAFDRETFAPVCEIPKTCRSWTMQTYISWLVAKLDRDVLNSGDAHAVCLDAAREFNRAHFRDDAGVDRYLENWVKVWIRREKMGSNNLARSGRSWDDAGGRELIYFDFNNAGKPKPQAEAVVVL